MKDVQNIIDRNKEAMIIPDGIVVIGLDLQIIVFNEAASRITGFDADEIVNSHCEVLCGDRTEEINYFNQSLNEKRVFSNLPLKILTKEGSYKDVLAAIHPIQKADKIVSIILTFRDTFEMSSLTDKLESKTKELLDEKNKLDAIFNSNIEGTFTIDHNWDVTSFNTSAENITGYKKDDALGKKCWEIFNSEKCQNGCHMEQTINEQKSTLGNELEITNKNKKKIPIRVNSGVLRNNKNEMIGAVETFIDISEIKNLTAHLDVKYNYENIVGKSKELKSVISVLESVSQTNSSVLITGESGTGKELAARAIHLNSSRRSMPFVALNCTAFVESLIESELFGHEKGAFTGAVKAKMGRFELAQGGTLFLDEIGDLSLAVQTKLLRVLEKKEFERVGGHQPISMDARIITATNKDLHEEIASKNFREDLFYRINVINIELPPLRKRKDDLPLLLDHFIKQFNKRFNKNITQCSGEAYEMLLDYNWPGNIRELENVVEHAFILCGSNTIMPKHLPKRLYIKLSTLTTLPDSRKDDLAEAEQQAIVNALKMNDGNRKKTAASLGIDTSTLWRKMKKHKIDIIKNPNSF